MDIYDIRRHRLKQWIDEDFGGVAAQFARAVKSEPNYITRVLSTNEKHRKRLGEKLARQFEEALAKPKMWLDQDPHGTQQIKADYIVLPIGAEHSPEDFVLVPDTGFRGSCGGGIINWDERLKRPLAFQKSWLEARGVAIDHAMLVYADGDSMKEFIHDGDVVLFDRSKRKLESGKIFAVKHPEGVRIKRVRIDYDGSVILSSDNSSYPEDRIPKTKVDELEVLGRFVWRGGG